MHVYKRILFAVLLCAVNFQSLGQAGGENCAQATTIPSLPFSGQGSTNGAIDDYFESCPDQANQGGAPDHVYQYTTGNGAQIISASLCQAETNYDSQLYIYEGFCGGPVIGCQEDGCASPAYWFPYNSEILNVMLQPNTTYYFVVDGYGGNDSGNYQLDITLGNGAPPDSSELPLVYIETNNQLIPDEPKLTGNMRIIYNGVGNLNYAADPYNEYDGYIGIEQRGSSSAMFPKKGYGLETRDSLGWNNNVPLFGMPAENDWVLHGPYSDKSLMRNEMSYYMGRHLTEWSPRTQYCELMINGVYQGVYLFMEKIKRDQGRVNISKLWQWDTTGDELTGGYIVKVDKFTGSNTNFWTSQYSTNSSNPQPIRILYHYPKEDSIVPEQQQYIQAYVDNFEDLLNGPNYQDPLLGYQSVADINSFVDYFLLSEAVKNVDAYRISTFLTKNKDSNYGKLRAGPIWDYNLAMGNADYCQGGPSTGWAYRFNSICPGDQWQVPFWWERLLTDPEFQNRLRCRWDSLRVGPFHTDSLLAHIDSMAAYIDNAQQRNFNRWEIMGDYVWPNEFVGNTYSEEIDYLKTWITDRMLWLDDNLPTSNGDCGFLHLPENTVSIELRVFPNPTLSDFYIEYAAQGMQSSVFVRDVHGRTVWSNEYHSSEMITLNSANIPALQNLMSGVYFITVQTENGQVQKKLVRN